MKSHYEPNSNELEWVEEWLNLNEGKILLKMSSLLSECSSSASSSSLEYQTSLASLVQEYCSCFKICHSCDNLTASNYGCSVYLESLIKDVLVGFLKKSDARSLEMAANTLSYIQNCAQRLSCVHPRILWSSILSFVPNHTESIKGCEMISLMYSVMETFTINYEGESHSNQETKAIQSSLDQQDSEVSLFEPLLSSQCEELAALTVSHLSRISSHCRHSGIKYQICNSLIVKFLLGKARKCSTIVTKCLDILEFLLDERDVLDIFIQQKMLQTILSFNPPVQSFHVILKYLNLLLCNLNQMEDSSQTLNSLEHQEARASPSKRPKLGVEEDALQPHLVEATKFWMELIMFFNQLQLSMGILDEPLEEIKITRLIKLAGFWSVHAKLCSSFTQLDDLYFELSARMPAAELQKRMLKACDIVMNCDTDKECQKKASLSILTASTRVLLRLADYQFNNLNSAENSKSSSSSDTPAGKLLKGALKEIHAKMLMLSSGDFSLNCGSIITGLLDSMLLNSKSSLVPFSKMSDSVDIENGQSSQEYPASLESESVIHQPQLAVKRSKSGLKVIVSGFEYLLPFLINLLVQLSEKKVIEIGTVEHFMWKVKKCLDSLPPCHSAIQRRMLINLLENSKLFLRSSLFQGKTSQNFVALMSDLCKDNSPRYRKILELIISLFKTECLASDLQGVINILKSVMEDAATPMVPTAWIAIPTAPVSNNNMKPNHARKGLVPLQFDPFEESTVQMSFKPPIEIFPKRKNPWKFESSQMFSVTFWLKKAELLTKHYNLKSSPSGYHILSFGTRENPFMVYHDHNCLKLRFAGGSTDIRFHSLPSGLWNLVAINCEYQSSEKEMEVQVILNGTKFAKQVIKCQTHIHPSEINDDENDETKYFFLHGHNFYSDDALENITFSLMVSTVHIFAHHVLSVDAVLNMMLLGPEPLPLSVDQKFKNDLCLRQLLCRFPQHTAKLQALSRESLLRSQVIDHVMVSYLPTRPDELILTTRHVQEHPHNGFFSFYKAKLNTIETDPPTQEYIKTCSKRTLTNIRARLDIAKLLNEVGSINTLILLVARVVELKSEDQVVADSLEILLMACQGSSLLARQFEDQNGYILLTRILSDKRCQFGLFTLKAILKYAFSHEVLLYCERRKWFSLAPSEKTTHITQPKILNLVLDSFQNASKRFHPDQLKMCDATYVSEMFVKAVNSVLQDKKPNKNSQFIRELEMAKRLVFLIYGDTLEEDRKVDEEDEHICDACTNLTPDENSLGLSCPARLKREKHMVLEEVKKM